MSLRDRAVADAAAILRKTKDGGQAIVLTDPSGSPTNLVGWTSDIGASIDPDTGAIVSGRNIRVHIDIGSLPAGPRPKGTADGAVKPWLVSFPNIVSTVSTQYAVARSVPDDTLGMITLILGNWAA